VNLHEYQARALLKAAGIPVPDGDVAGTPEEAAAIAKRLGSRVVIKAQVHAGGRGKAGGVKLADPGEAAAVAGKILGMTIKGLVVHKVLVAPAAEIASESYVGLLVDRESQRPVFMVSRAGGVDIEEVAATTPEKIVRLAVDPRYGLMSHQAFDLALALYDDVGQARAAATIMQQLYRAFVDNGAQLAEINQGLMALRATIHMGLLGREGMREVANLCVQKSHHAARLAEALDELLAGARVEVETLEADGAWERARRVPSGPDRHRLPPGIQHVNA